MKNDCAYKEKCMQIMTMQMLAMYAGRSLACAPSCEYCNNYKRNNETLDHLLDIRVDKLKKENKND